MSLVTLLVAVIVIGLLYYVVTLLPLPQPFKTIALVIVLLIAIVWLLNASGLWRGDLRVSNDRAPATFETCARA